MPPIMIPIETLETIELIAKLLKTKRGRDILKQIGPLG